MFYLALAHPTYPMPPGYLLFIILFTEFLYFTHLHKVHSGRGPELKQKNTIDKLIEQINKATTKAGRMGKKADLSFSFEVAKAVGLENVFSCTVTPQKFSQWDSWPDSDKEQSCLQCNLVRSREVWTFLGWNLEHHSQRLIWNISCKGIQWEAVPFCDPAWTKANWKRLTLKSRGLKHTSQPMHFSPFCCCPMLAKQWIGKHLVDTRAPGESDLPRIIPLGWRGICGSSSSWPMWIRVSNHTVRVDPFPFLPDKSWITFSPGCLWCLSFIFHCAEDHSTPSWSLASLFISMPQALLLVLAPAVTWKPRNGCTEGWALEGLPSWNIQLKKNWKRQLLQVCSLDVSGSCECSGSKLLSDGTMTRTLHYLTSSLKKNGVESKL